MTPTDETTFIALWQQGWTPRRSPSVWDELLTYHRIYVNT
jgi:hypothetical protein